jgi:hypothetical protein
VLTSIMIHPSLGRLVLSARWSPGQTWVSQDMLRPLPWTMELKLKKDPGLLKRVKSSDRTVFVLLLVVCIILVAILLCLF